MASYTSIFSYLLPVYIIMLALGVLFYVFYSIGLYTIAKRRGLRYPGLAWVPVANDWMLGLVADQVDLIYAGKKSKQRLRLLWFSAGVYLLAAFFLIAFLTIVNSYQSFSSPFSTIMVWFPMIFWAVAITYTVFYYIALYKLYRSCSPDNAVPLIVLSIIFSVIIPFVMLVIRKSDKGIPRVSDELPAEESGLK